MSKSKATQDKPKGPPSFEWESVLTDGRVKSVIQAEDANAGVFRKNTLQLIKTCSSLLLRKVVQQSSRHKQPHTNDKNGPSVLVLSARDLKDGVADQEESSLGFLQTALENAAAADTGKMARPKAKRKQPPPATDNNKPRNKKSKTAGVEEESIQQALEISQQQGATTAHDHSTSEDKITLDEEDYD
ncbi:expressed unknown protein [Seminavis robusta]|uniref:Uncharacterized protein n=1 Tax=Seminavis robusta TaxID=568900 RepID=A0A9N8EF32_9STRA|nr:expressed unknown protein [Seminavis robusta]|eukprot:Sro850_g210780.1 n/a (187) ;mRNA; r:41866-42426